VHEAKDAYEAQKIYDKHQPNIMIVDINLPKKSGLEFIKEIRQNDLTRKIIMLTAYDSTQFLMDSIPLQLTSYLIKPITRNELKKALQQAVNELQSYTVVSNKYIVLKENYKWDIELKELKQHDKKIALTQKERLLIELLLSRKDKMFNYDEIFDYVWGYENIGTLDGLKNLIARLRKKLPKDTIENCFNEGYKISF
jgi:DNA-binding response OmpR family regulator